MKLKTSRWVITLLNLLLIIAVFIVLKNSSITTPSFIPDFLSKILQKPLAKTNNEEVFRLLENLSLALISGYIIYLIIDFIPNLIASKKAFLICESNITEIFLTMSSILAPLKMLGNIYKDDQEVSLNELEFIKDYSPKNEKTYYKAYSGGNMEKEHSKGIFVYHHSLGDFSKTLDKQLENLLKLPIASNLDYQLIEIISSIHNCSFLKRSKQLSDSSIKDKPYSTHKFDEYFYNFLQLYLKLEKYDFTKYKYIYHKLPQDEILNLETERELIFKTVSINDGKFYKNGIEYIVIDGKLLK